MLSDVVECVIFLGYEKKPVVALHDSMAQRRWLSYYISLFLLTDSTMVTKKSFN